MMSRLLLSISFVYSLFVTPPSSFRPQALSFSARQPLRCSLLCFICCCFDRV